MAVFPFFVGWLWLMKNSDKHAEKHGDFDFPFFVV